MFKDILSSLLGSVEGSTAAFLAGMDGLLVEHCCRAEGQEPDLEQLAADCTQLIKNGSGLLDDLHELVLSGTSQRLVLRLIPESYFVGLVLSPQALAGQARYALCKLQSALEKEIGD
jgi:predicted regulator of Ras-like GTPase activity (Roadblock/LC7/MglB family)